MLKQTIVSSPRLFMYTNLPFGSTCTVAGSLRPVNPESVDCLSMNLSTPVSVSKSNDHSSEENSQVMNMRLVFLSKAAVPRTGAHRALVDGGEHQLLAADAVDVDPLAGLLAHHQELARRVDHDEVRVRTGLSVAATLRGVVRIDAVPGQYVHVLELRRWSRPRSAPYWTTVESSYSNFSTHLPSAVSTTLTT